jgi:hypothetical protein
MSEFGDQSPTGISWQGNVGVVEYGGGSKNQLAIFYNKSVHNPGKSREQGTPIYDDKVYIRVHPPGERLNIVDRPANGDDARRWPVQWAQFQQNREQTPEGTPIDLLYPDRPAIAATLRAAGVHTVEACAELTANAIENVGMGAQSWVNAAQKYLTYANKGVGAATFRRELEDRDGQIRVLNQQLEMLKAEVNQLRATNTTGLDLAKVQAMIQAASERPAMPLATDTRSMAFDAQKHQIDALGTVRNEKKRTRIKP